MNRTSQNLLVGAVALGVLAAMAYGARMRWGAGESPGTARRKSRKLDQRLDEALDQTFPASDPPATQDFDIPANRA